jgi:hypothetical protein
VDDEFGTRTHQTAVFLIKMGLYKILGHKPSKLSPPSLDDDAIPDSHTHVPTMGTGQPGIENIATDITKLFIKPLINHIYILFTCTQIIAADHHRTNFPYHSFIWMEDSLEGVSGRVRVGLEN